METIGSAFRDRGRDKDNNFMLLRLFAASLVVFGHSATLSAGIPGYKDVFRKIGYSYSGDIGLYIFFVISGFLVYFSLERGADVRKYFVSRALRIFPGLIVFLVFSSLVVGALITSMPPSEYYSNEWTWRYIYYNFSLLGYQPTLPAVFSGEKNSSLAGTLWTLSIEFRLYIIVAIVGVFGIMNSRLASNAALVVIVVVGMVSPEQVPLIGGDAEAIRISAFFAAGSLIYVNRNSIPLDWICFVVLVVACFFSYGGKSYYLIFSSALVYLIFLISFSSKINLPSWVKDFSYGIYLYGWMVQKLIHYAIPEINPYQMMALSIPLSWVAGAISWHLVEKRCLAWKDSKILRLSSA